MYFKYTFEFNKAYPINKKPYTVSVISSYDRGLLAGTRIYILDPVDSSLPTLTATHWPDGTIDRVKPYVKHESID